MQIVSLGDLHPSNNMEAGDLALVTGKEYYSVASNWPGSRLTSAVNPDKMRRLGFKKCLKRSDSTPFTSLALLSQPGIPADCLAAKTFVQIGRFQWMCAFGLIRFPFQP